MNGQALVQSIGWEDSEDGESIILTDVGAEWWTKELVGIEVYCDGLIIFFYI